MKEDYMFKYPMDNPSIHYQKNNKVDIMHESYFEDQVFKLFDKMNNESRSFTDEIDNQISTPFEIFKE